VSVPNFCTILFLGSKKKKTEVSRSKLKSNSGGSPGRVVAPKVCASFFKGAGAGGVDIYLIIS
jgi:hypothetical protein